MKDLLFSEKSDLESHWRLDGYEFDSWKKFFEYTKLQDSKTSILLRRFRWIRRFLSLLADKRARSAVGGAPPKDKKIAPAKAERGKVSLANASRRQWLWNLLLIALSYQRSSLWWSRVLPLHEGNGRSSKDCLLSPCSNRWSWSANHKFVF